MILCKDKIIPENKGEKFITTLVFKVKNVPSALYKAMGGFATNGVNMLKLESYQVDGSFQSTQFYTDLEGHLESEAIKTAIDELEYYSEEIKICVFTLQPEIKNKKANKTSYIMCNMCELRSILCIHILILL